MLLRSLQQAGHSVAPAWRDMHAASLSVLNSQSATLPFNLLLRSKPGRGSSKLDMLPAEAELEASEVTVAGCTVRRRLAGLWADSDRACIPS